MLAVIKLIRVRQWVKNLFIFIPSFFAGQIFEPGAVMPLLLGFLCFSLVASSIYVLNDYRDREVDRIHPEKRNRPLASGAVNLSTAWAVMMLFSIAGFFISYLLDPVFFWIIVAYFVMNVAYSMGLKHIPIVDLFIVSFGFLLRIYGGGAIANISITHWLSVMILLLALFLIVAKRRDDILLQMENGNCLRKSSQSYNLEFINSCLTLISAVVIVAYIMYTVSPEVTERFESDNLFLTTVFVIAGMMRYLQITFVEKNSGSPTTIFVRDKFILLTIVGWIFSFYIIIYYA